MSCLFGFQTWLGRNPAQGRQDLLAVNLQRPHRGRSGGILETDDVAPSRSTSRMR